MADVHVNIEQQLRIREQVLDKITNISPKDRPFLAALKRRDATNTKVEWTKDALAAASSTNTNNHGFTVTFDAADWAARTQDFNNTQLLKKQASVDLSHESVEKVGLGRGPNTELGYQKELKMDELMNDVEATLLSNNDRVAPLPNTGTAGQSRGATRWISTNVITCGAGSYPERTLEPEYYDDANQKAWSKGGAPDKVFCGVQAKRAVNGWITQVNRPVSDAGKKLTAVVNQYEGVTGMQDLLLSRNLSTVLLLIEVARWETAWLREPKWYPIAQTGDFLGGYYATELTLVALAEASSAKIENLNYTI